jgi:hypothetical protein
MFIGDGMLNTLGNDDEGERQGGRLTLLQVLNQLEREMLLLSEEKADLLDIEEKLWFMIHEKIDYRRSKNEELRTEVEEQKRTCVELTRILNRSIREQ